MSFKNIIKKLGEAKKPMLAVLIDPDKFNPELVRLANKNKVSCFLVGGSELKKGDVTKTIIAIKKISKIPVILFPGNETQLSKKADGLLLLSLLSGRNPDYLISKHITAAPIIRKMKLEHLPTAYLLIDGGKVSTTQRVTGTRPLDPKNKTLLINTVIAAGQLGFKAVYLEAGSGANISVSATLIKSIKRHSNLPLIVGGGINSPQKAQKIINAGANMIVIGNALEKNVFLISEISKCF